MSEEARYSIHLDIEPGSMTRIDLPAIAAAVEDPWWNRSLCRVNDCVVRLGVVQGEFHWHAHAVEDEMFLVLEGTLLLDLEERTVELGPHQGFTVPRGVMHRTRAPQRVVMLMVEGGGCTGRRHLPPGRLTASGSAGYSGGRRTHMPAQPRL